MTIPEMVMPSAWSTVLFVVIVLFVCGATVVGVRLSAPADEAVDTTRRWMVGTVLLLGAWLAITAAVMGSGVLAQGGMPPPMMLFFAVSNLLALVFALSPAGARLARLPAWALVGFQSFRLPLELVLHQWMVEGVLPVQMTFEGHNFDIVTGLFALG